MSPLTLEQKSAIARFKDNLHLPGNGFHALIIEQCREYQLPFQAVRTVFMKSQASIEEKIRYDFRNIDDNQLTMEHWLSLIRNQLSELAASNVPVMEKLTSGKRYLELNATLSKDVKNTEQKEQIQNLFEDVYELEISKPLKAMLRTTSLFWAVKSSLFEMTEEQREKFGDYPQYMEAIEHLLDLAAQNDLLPLD